MVKKEFGTIKIENVKTVVSFFSQNDRGTAREIGASGSFMHSLCERGYVRVVDTIDTMVCINEYVGLYRKIPINVYALTVSPTQLYDFYCSSVTRLADIKKSDAECLIAQAKDKLTEVENMLAQL